MQKRMDKFSNKQIIWICNESALAGIVLLSFSPAAPHAFTDSEAKQHVISDDL